MSIRVFLVEDHEVMRNTLVDYLGIEDGIEVCGTAASADEALRCLGDTDASLVLLDLSLDGRSGLDLLSTIRDRWRLPCVILSGHGERMHVERAIAAGASGYVLKGRASEVPGAIRSVAAGGSYLSESLRASVADVDTGA